MHRKEDVKRVWHLVDAKGQILGRLAVQIAAKLIGKGKRDYTPHVDGGDYVVVINAEKIEVTRNKLAKKIYTHHSGFPGGLKQQALCDLLTEHPQRVIEKAVHNMLPKNRLRALRMNRLKVYVGETHPHIGQLSSQTCLPRI